MRDHRLDDDFDAHKALEDDEELAPWAWVWMWLRETMSWVLWKTLETNDPHLDDLLNGDEFDLLAYTDPELDTGTRRTSSMSI